MEQPRKGAVNSRRDLSYVDANVLVFKGKFVKKTRSQNRQSACLGETANARLCRFS